jgi:hypothetical protein
MSSPRPEYVPVNGKTYSLFGKSNSTEGYYKTICLLADKVLAMDPDIRMMVEDLREFSSKKRMLKRSLKTMEASDRMPVVLNLIDSHLKLYTENVEEHLRTLPLSKLWDRRLNLEGAVSSLYA